MCAREAPRTTTTRKHEAMTTTTTTKAKTYIVGTRIRRFFQHPLTRETTALRFNPVSMTVSSPMRAGCDIGPVVHIRWATIDQCRAAWCSAEADLIAEGFEISRRGGKPTTEMY